MKQLLKKTLSPLRSKGNEQQISVTETQKAVKKRSFQKKENKTMDIVESYNYNQRLRKTGRGQLGTPHLSFPVRWSLFCGASYQENQPRIICKKTTGAVSNRAARHLRSQPKGKQ